MLTLLRNHPQTGQARSFGSDASVDHNHKVSVNVSGQLTCDWLVEGWSNICGESVRLTVRRKSPSGRGMVWNFLCKTLSWSEINKAKAQTRHWIYANTTYNIVFFSKYSLPLNHIKQMWFLTFFFLETHFVCFCSSLCNGQTFASPRILSFLKVSRDLPPLSVCQISGLEEQRILVFIHFTYNSTP